MSTDNSINKVTLDMSLDDLDDLPQYLQPPTGAYVMVMEEGIVEKDLPSVGDKEPMPIFEIALKIKQVVEVEKSALDEDEEMPKPGDTFTLGFQRTNTFGMGNFKEFLKPIAKKLGQTNIGVIMGASKGMEVAVILVRTYNKAKQKNYTKVRKLEVL